MSVRFFAGHLKFDPDWRIITAGNSFSNISLLNDPLLNSNMWLYIRHASFYYAVYSWSAIDFSTLAYTHYAIMDLLSLDNCLRVVR